MTSAATELFPDTATSSRTTHFLTSVIISAIAPVFFGITGGDIAQARVAAAEIINDYGLRSRVDVIAVGQMVANGLAALKSLGQFMDEEISLPLALRLRGNAISLNRTVEHNRRVRRQNKDVDPLPIDVRNYAEPAPAKDAPPNQPDAFPTDVVLPDAFLTDGATQLLDAEAATRLACPADQSADPASAETIVTATTAATEDRRQRRTQAMAMIKEAGDLSDILQILPPEEREPTEIRIAMLGRSARELITGERLPPPGQTGGAIAMSGSG
jgi:hypothetical protein